MKIHVSTVKKLSVETVLAIHEHLVLEFSQTEDPISPPGVRDLGLLESAVHRQNAGSKDYLKYDTPCSNAASLMFGICNNHPFYNGNKRTALVSGLMHLDTNGLVLEGVTKDDLYRLMIRIATHAASKEGRKYLKKGGRRSADDEITAITGWLEDYARPIRRGERNITYGQLYKILEKFEYRLGDKRHNKLEILKRKKTLFGGEKWICVYKVPCPGDGRTAGLNGIKAIREALELTEEHGVDSESFYNTYLIIDSFVRTHRNVLRKLAKV